MARTEKGVLSISVHYAVKRRFDLREPSRFVHEAPLATPACRVLQKALGIFLSCQLYL